MFYFIIVLIFVINISMIELKNIRNFRNKYYFSFIFMCEILFLLRDTVFLYQLQRNL